MTLDENWVTETARLIKEREHAQAGIARWQEKLDAANAALATRAGQETEQVQAPE